MVARTDVDYRRPILFRREPYEVHTWVSHVGTSSFTLSAEVRDPAPVTGRAGEVLAASQVVAVGFDAETQRASQLSSRRRERLLAELAE